MVCHSSAKIRRRRSEAYRKINNYVIMSFCLKINLFEINFD